ncbi:hypothetical protein E4T42_08333 [Aureobasidium subglaciale]|nr:hypothetical protein E4T42_08333 [Aureobasidium subglaciale]
MRQPLSVALGLLVLLFSTFVLASPVSPNPAFDLIKRSACSNGIKVNCGSSSVGCSGNQCTVCCAPRDNSCSSSTPLVNPDCSGKCGSGGGSSSTGGGSSSSGSSAAKPPKNPILCRYFRIGC